MRGWVDAACSNPGGAIVVLVSLAAVLVVYAIAEYRR